MGLSRRNFLAGGGTALGTFFIGGRWVAATPANARDLGFTPQVLSAAQCEALEIVGDALVPGALKAGLAPFIDSQLALASGSKLIAKYLGVNPLDQRGFYSAIADSLITNLAIPDSEPGQLINSMATDAVKDWTGPPASYAFIVLRADALDVTYGTPDGFAALDIPYAAHIQPELYWKWAQ